MTLFKKGEDPYWILYEGTPGGSSVQTTIGFYHLAKDCLWPNIICLKINGKEGWHRPSGYTSVMGSWIERFT